MCGLRSRGMHASRLARKPSSRHRLASLGKAIRFSYSPSNERFYHIPLLLSLWVVDDQADSLLHFAIDRRTEQQRNAEEVEPQQKNNHGANGSVDQRVIVEKRQIDTEHD